MTDPLMIFLRIVHIFFGLFWAGAGLFAVAVLTRRLKQLDPATSGRVIAAIGPSSGIAFTVAGYLVVGSGAAMALRIKWGVLNTFFDAGWGYAIVIAFAMATISAIVGPTLIFPAVRRVETLVAGQGEAAPTPDATANLDVAIRRFSRIAAWDSGLIIIALGAMASARWL